MVNAQEWLDKNYPKENRKEITELSINEEILENNLDLTDFTQLTKLDFSNNYLTEYLPNNSKLTYLDITNNDFPSQSLSMFSQLTNLEGLFIRNEIKHWKSSRKETLITKHKFQNGIYNKFFGSFKPLKNLNKLKNLDVSNTKIDSGLEFLPKNLELFRCQNIPNEKIKEWVKERINKKEKILEYEDERVRNGLFSCLTTWVSFDIFDCAYELQNWRQNNLLLINKLKENDSLLKRWKEKELHKRIEGLEKGELDWTNINPNFTPELTQSWQNLNFTYSQTQDWINAGLNPTDYSFCAWLRDIKNLTPEQVLNHENIQSLNQEWQQNQFQTQIQQPPK